MFGDVQVPLLCQQSGQPPSGFVVWDYHVIALLRRPNSDRSRTLPACPQGIVQDVASASTIEYQGVAAPKTDPSHTALDHKEDQLQLDPAKGGAGAVACMPCEAIGLKADKLQMDSATRGGEATSRVPYEAIVLDLDTTLPFPCHAATYLQSSIASLRSPALRCEECAIFFRVVHAAAYLECFASDRSHMLRVPSTASTVKVSYVINGATAEEVSYANNGRRTSAEHYLAKPPAEPCIRGPLAGGAHVLPRYWDMVADRVGENDTVRWHTLDKGPYGSVLSLIQMLSLCDVTP
jgi:hypothetical protein